jgi:hypothetical protein
MDVPNKQGQQQSKRPGDFVVANEPKVLPDEGQQIQKQHNVAYLYAMGDFLEFTSKLGWACQSVSPNFL